VLLGVPHPEASGGWKFRFPSPLFPLAPFLLFLGERPPCRGRKGVGDSASRKSAWKAMKNFPMGKDKNLPHGVWGRP